MPMTPAARQKLPPHVPPEVAGDVPLFARKAIEENPHETIIPELRATLPPVAYVTNIFPGKQPGWLLGHAEEGKALLQDTEHFVKKGMGKCGRGIGENCRVIPTQADPPIHSLYRRELNPHFSPQKITVMGEQI